MPAARRMRVDRFLAPFAALALVALLVARAMEWADPPPDLDLALGLVVAWGVLRWAGIAAAERAIVVGAIALYALYVSYTSASERNYDVGPHLMYVRYVADHLALPAKYACNICHHPPAYYVAAAALHRALALAHASDPTLGLQLFALVLVTIFVACAALVLQRTLPAGAPRLVATAIVAFWPYGVIDAGRVGNDAMFYAIAGATMLALVQIRAFHAAAAWVAASLVVLGLLTKSNAVVLAALFFLTCAREIVRASRRLSRARALLPPIALVLVGAFAASRVRADASKGILERLLGNAWNAPASSLSPRSSHTYLWFDLREFLASPFDTVSMLGRSDAPFWNQLLKSSLLGTRRSALGTVITDEPIVLARALAVLLLLLLVSLLVGQLVSMRAANGARRTALVAACVFVAASVTFHLVVPFGFHADFRFIHPVLVPLAWLWADGAARLARRARALGAATLGVGALFVLTSIAYFLPFTWSAPPERRPTPIGDLSHLPAASSADSTGARRFPRLLGR